MDQEERNHMGHIEFYNREKETRELTRILSTDPTLITFIYGPINSGKTELITNLIKNLPESQKVFYINLRGRFVSNYDNFIKVLFDIERTIIPFGLFITRQGNSLPKCPK